MSRQTKKDDTTSSNRKPYRGKGNGRKYDKRDKGKTGKTKSETRDEERETSGSLIPVKGQDKNPNWYFTDRAMAEQVTQMAFQNLAGLPIDAHGISYDIPNVNTILLNPSPGVTKSVDYGSILLNKMAGVNLAGFRFFSELAAYTGRSAIYGPQDISTMILGLGEVLSIMEVIRRAFGVCFTMNMRNRSYPRAILEQGMFIDADDLFANFSDYRTRYNTLVTMVNQIPIPATIAYLDKCQKIYEEIYLDTESAMAQTLVTMPFTTWILDETSYSGGTILKTVPVLADPNATPAYSHLISTTQPLSYFLNIADSLIGAMLNSSTLNVVYTDILNLASKKGVTFLKMDYLAEGYAVVPRFSQEFCLQMHNATLTGGPMLATFNTNPYITPLNDVYPNASTNSLYYNPGFNPMNLSPLITRTGNEVIVDMLNDNPDVVDRIEVLRYTSIGAKTPVTISGVGYVYDAVLPDHYVVCIRMWATGDTHAQNAVNQDSWWATMWPNTNTGGFANNDWERLCTLISKVDWAPRFYQYDYTSNVLTGNYTGDANFYTVVGEDWLRKVNQFICLALYTIR